MFGTTLAPGTQTLTSNAQANKQSITDLTQGDDDGGVNSALNAQPQNNMIANAKAANFGARSVVTSAVIIVGGAITGPEAEGGEDVIASETSGAKSSRGLTPELASAANAAFRDNSKLVNMSAEDREYATQAYDRIAASVKGSKPTIARLYNIERAKFLRGEVPRIADRAVAFAKEHGL
jgi:hypothetical protein